MYPERIVCLAAEIPEILHRLGALQRVVGISAYTTRPPEALDIPKVSGFQHGSTKRILSNRPDVAILTSGVQKDLASELSAQGVTTIHLNPHRLEDMYNTILLIGNVVGAPEKAVAYEAQLRQAVEDVRQKASKLPFRPKIYFEEWMDPIIVGTGWVSDLIEIAGGQDVFREKSIRGRYASDRVVDKRDIISAEPDIVLASWCGKPFDRDSFLSRPDFANIPAVKGSFVYEMNSEILQCGPMLIDSLKIIHHIIEEFVAHSVNETR
ncbi:ABC transporter substrate-binding protein [Alicyclobacillus fodiniaquatilis]|jgi:iron complex transport system substrate-binding protein|uniref:ABC transporter substrate-binding protein n=1 Tax=Alicyclobacillus fodiniaquatilis TaxID=1661150 RepID=A0ABW4JIY5_9BACL